MKVALVIKYYKDQRCTSFGKLFGGLGHDTVLAYGDGRKWAPIDAETGAVLAPLSSEQRPTRVDCVLIHGSDYDDSWPQAKAQLKDGYGKAYIFNASGDPPTKDGMIRILRSTNPFGLTPKHATELCDHAADTSAFAPLPSCCVHTAKHLIALDILCQGYLFAHGLLIGAPGSKSGFLTPEARKRIKLSTESTEWWLRGLGVQSLEELPAKFQEEELPPASAEEVANKLHAALCPDATQVLCPDATQAHLIMELRKLLAELLS